VTILSDDEWFDLLGPEPVKAPWSHQTKEFDEHRDTKCRALLWSMRTGKSKAVIDKAEYQFSKGAIEGVVVLAPNGIHLNWVINEIPKWSWPTNGQAMAFGWEAPRRGDFGQIAKLDALYAHTGGLKWLTVNMEAFGSDKGVATKECIKAVRKFVATCHGKFMLAISEAHHFGRASAKRTKMARNLGRIAKFITVETGTAILNSPLRAYSIYKILNDEAFGPEFAGDTFGKFHSRIAVVEDSTPKFEPGDPSSRYRRNTGRRYKKVTGYKNLDWLQERMAQWSSVVLREDIEDMPPLIRTERIIQMSETQRRAYLEMVSRHLVEIGDDMVSAKDAGARVQKLQQILNGYIKDGDDIIDIDPLAPVYDALMDEVGGGLPGKTIVWCRYREDIRRVCARLKSEGFRVLEFHGGVPTEQREGIRLAFNNDPSYNVLVGHPGAGGEGRDFSGADAVIFFSSTPNAIHVTQGEERATLVAGHPVSVVRFRTPGTVDDRNWGLVDGKLTVADDLSGRGLRDLLLRTDV
jgi:hypothetical protein